MSKPAYEEFKADFKEKYGIDIDEDAYNKIMADEKRAQEVQKEAEELSGSASACEESNAKCNQCGQGLSYAEHIFYGNRCLFCAEDKQSLLNLVTWLLRAYYDYRIYLKLLAVKEKMGKEGRLMLLGCLGVLGMTDINQAKTVKDKRALFRELRDYGKLK